jgi:hypothetical protein
VKPVDRIYGLTFASIVAALPVNLGLVTDRVVAPALALASLVLFGVAGWSALWTAGSGVDQEQHRAHLRRLRAGMLLVLCAGVTATLQRMVYFRRPWIGLDVAVLLQMATTVLWVVALCVFVLGALGRLRELRPPPAPEVTPASDPAESPPASEDGSPPRP